MTHQSVVGDDRRGLLYVKQDDGGFARRCQRDGGRDHRSGGWGEIHRSQNGPHGVKGTPLRPCELRASWLS